jgi:hypothetical protein
VTTTPQPYYPADPAFSSISFPTLPSLVLSAAEQAVIGRLLSLNWTREKLAMRLSEAYYLGEQVVDNLRIAVPAELEFLREVLNWPALAVDPYVERHALDGFRLPNATDADERLGDMWALAGMDTALSLAVTDALSLGRGWFMVGTGDSDLPKVTVESPLNIAAEWDLTGTKPTAALVQYWSDGRHHASLMVPGKTTTIATNDKGEWVVAARDEHDFDFVPLVRMAHMPRTNARGGRSAITQAIRSTTDSACRDLLSLEVAREIYSVPGITLLGAAEKDFQASDGTPKSAWDAYITRVRALEVNPETGEAPTIHQMQVYDPSVFTKILDMRAARISSMVAAPPQDVGIYTEGNPPSADAVEFQEGRRNRRARLQQKMSLSPAVVEVVQMMLRFQNKGNLPPEFARMEADWVDLDETPLSVVAPALQLLISGGAIPATSDVTLRKAGFSAVERRRLAQDRKLEDGRAIARQLAATVTPAPTQPGNQPSGTPGL